MFMNNHLLFNCIAIEFTMLRLPVIESKDSKINPLNCTYALVLLTIASFSKNALFL